MDAISYEGLTEAEVIHALYHGTQPLGFGVLHNDDELTVAKVEDVLARYEPLDRDGKIRLDYFAGRPLKVELDTNRKLIGRADLYDRDAGVGQCARVIERARARKAA